MHGVYFPTQVTISQSCANKLQDIGVFLQLGPTFGALYEDSDSSPLMCRLWTSGQMSRDGSPGALLLLLGQLGLNLMWELVQVLVHTPHAEPLGVEDTAVLI